MLKFGEAGRSMVEMLGVLAIVGVLSVGGIAGYNYALNKNKVNDILDGVSKRAIVMSQQIIMGNKASLVEYEGKKIGDYAVEGGTYEGDEFLWIDVKGVEQNVCERIMDMEWRLPSGILVNEQTAIAENCLKEGNTLTFDFSRDLGASGCPAGYTGENCTEHIVCENGGKWTPDGCVCEEGWYGLACDTDCEGWKDENGVCRDCGTNTYTTTEKECHRCDDRFFRADGKCMRCLVAGAQEVSKEECDRCDNRYYNETDGKCYRICDEEGWFKATTGSCYECTIKNPYAATEEECNRCDNRYLDSTGRCAQKLDCGEHGDWSDEKKACVCDDGWYGDNCESYCDGFISDSEQYGRNCRSCTPQSSGHVGVYNVTEEECHKCPNTVWAETDNGPMCH